MRTTLYVFALALWLSLGAVAQPAAVAPSTTAPKSITDADLKAIAPPDAEARAKGDPGGALTGTVADVGVSRQQGRPHPSGSRQPGGPEQDRHQLRLDADRRLPGDVHAGRVRDGGNGAVPRQERQPHHDDELHGVRRRHAGLLADRLSDPDGRRRAPSAISAARPPSTPEYVIKLFGKTFRAFRPERLLPDAQRHL